VRRRLFEVDEKGPAEGDRAGSLLHGVLVTVMGGLWIDWIFECRSLASVPMVSLGASIGERNEPVGKEGER